MTVICPVHNEELSIEYFLKRFNAVRTSILDRYIMDVLFVNNASTDRTLDLILAARSSDSSIQVLTQSRNFGYQASLMCGLAHVSADAYIFIDVDCEDPPEMIKDFLREWEKGADLVYGIRRERPEPQILVAARKSYYRITRLIADWEFVLDMAEFSLFTERVRQVIITHRSTFPFVRSDLAYVGLRRVGIAYSREPRRFGTTHYNFLRMSKYAISGVLSASTFPLRVLAYIGLPLAALNLLYTVIAYFRNSSVLFTTVVALNLTFLTLGVSFLAIYLARVSKDVVGRPVFIVDYQKSATNSARSDSLSKPR